MLIFVYYKKIQFKVKLRLNGIEIKVKNHRRTLWEIPKKEY